MTDDQSTATAALYESANDRESPEYFTRGEHAGDERQSTYLLNTMELIVPAALAVILAVLAFSYRDLVDVAVGFAGVVLSVLWMFGILGWLQIPAGVSVIIGPVLIVGLSVDYGLHVFMRYREQRDEGQGIREPMARGLSSVSVALGLVTMTAMIGFLSNATSDLTVIRQLAFAITLGVLSTFVVSLTLVPALKVTVDRLLERVGIDRRKQPLGKTGLLQPVLRSGASLARRGAPVVIVLALVLGSAGAVAWTDLDRQSLQQQQGEVADWKQDLPGPMGWEVSEESRQRTYVADHYWAASEDRRSRSNVLVEGDVTDPAAPERVRAVHEAAGVSDVVYRRGDTVPVTSPLTVMVTVAAEDEAFAETLRAADTDGDGVPDRDVEAVYDALYAAAPDRARQVVDREDGEYRSLRVVVPVESGATITERAEGVRAIAAAGDGDVDRFQKGDRVIASGMDREAGGTFAEYAALLETKLAQLPDDVPFEVGGAIGNVGATAWTALEAVAGVSPGDRVLVRGGAGGVGHAAVQIAAAGGADVIATAGSTDACDRVRELGASTAMRYDSDTLAEDVLSATGGDGVETVLDHRLEACLDLDLEVVAEGGQSVAIMGHVPEANGLPFYSKEVTLRALRMDSHPVRTPVLERLGRLLQRGELTGVVAETYGLDEVAQAHRDVLAGGYVGKLVVTP